MKTVSPTAVVDRLRECLTGGQSWIVIAPRAHAPELLGPLVAALEGGGDARSDDALTGELDAFASPYTLLQITIVLIRRSRISRDALVASLVAGGWAPPPAGGRADLFAITNAPAALLGVLRQVRLGTILPLPAPES